MGDQLCSAAVPEGSKEVEDQPETLEEAFLRILKQRKYCEVTFTFPNLPDRIEAHELVFRVRSPVFEQMYQMGKVRGKEIEITEATPQRFQAFLEHCVRIFETADRLGLNELKDQAGDTMVNHLAFLIGDSSLANSDEDTIMHLLGRDDLNVKEVELFEFVVDWGEHQIAPSDDQELLKKKLKQLLTKTRFTNMAPYEFTTRVKPKGFLSVEELLSVYEYVGGNETTRWLNFLHMLLVVKN